MTHNTINLLLIVSPLVIGVIIAAMNSEGFNGAIEKSEAWIRRVQSKVAAKSSNLNRYLINPFLWLIVKFSDLTASFTHRGIKSGLRVAVTLYLLIAWCYLIYAAFVIAVVLIVIGVVIYILYKILSSSNSEVKSSSQTGQETADPGNQPPTEDAK